MAHPVGFPMVFPAPGVPAQGKLSSQLGVGWITDDDNVLIITPFRHPHQSSPLFSDDALGTASARREGDEGILSTQFRDRGEEVPLRADADLGPRRAIGHCPLPGGR